MKQIVFGAFVGFVVSQVYAWAIRRYNILPGELLAAFLIFLVCVLGMWL